MTSNAFAVLERQRLCDLAVELGPNAPTLCAGWNTNNLIVHLYDRENTPLMIAVNALIHRSAL